MAQHTSRKTKNSNLFNINFDTIEASLADANSKLVGETESLLLSANQLPEQVGNNEEADDLKKFIQKLRNQIKEVASARLSDGRPFSEAKNVIKHWFLNTEDELKAKNKTLSERLVKYTSQIVHEASNQKDRKENTTIGISFAGDPVVSVNVTTPNLNLNEGSLNIEIPDVPLHWEVKSFNRDLIPIEKIRHYFTENSIRQALNKHLHDNGPHQLLGVEYIHALDKNLNKKATTNNLYKVDNKSSPLDQIQKHAPKAYAPWIPQEEAKLRTLYTTGMSHEEIAEELGRQPGGITSRLRYLGLID